MASGVKESVEPKPSNETAPSIELTRPGRTSMRVGNVIDSASASEPPGSPGSGGSGESDSDHATLNGRMTPRGEIDAG